MQGDPQVLGLLNELLSGELTAVHQYMLHARMFQNWGYERLFEKIQHESRDELNHADELIERILYLDGTPDVQKLGKVEAGASVHEQLKLDHALERGVRDALNRGIELCRKAGDNGSAELLERFLEETEGHHHWLEKQLTVIEQIGIQNYLSEQLKGGGAS